MLELPVASFRVDQHPPFGLEPSDHLSNLHPTTLPQAASTRPLASPLPRTILIRSSDSDCGITSAFQPRRLKIASAVDGCKRLLAAHAM
jgi:hypothetical protein